MYMLWFYIGTVMIFLSVLIWEEAMGRCFCIQGFGNVLCVVWVNEDEQVYYFMEYLMT